MTVEADVGARKTLARGSLATLLSFRHHNRPHRDPDDEIFHEPTVIFTLEGAWQYRSLDTDVAVGPDAVVLGCAGQHYRCRHLEAIPTDRHLVLRLNTAALEDLFSRYGAAPRWGTKERPLFPRTVVPQTPALAGLRQALFSEAQRKRPSYLLKIDLLAAAVLVELLRASGREEAPAEPRHALPSTRRHRDGIEAARAYAAAHLAGEIDLASLARAAGLSPYYFSRMFKAHVGVSPYRYLTRLRIAEAMRLLETSTLPVTEICYEVGFRNLSHFITTFGAHAGVSPMRYRRSRKNS
ncbi:MAG TPA: helix-turn-helix transcriptional regulator [bacterium]|nr:helix-turn-helix transcriptional regulator [bacterium]